MDELSPPAAAMVRRGRWHKTERNPLAIAEMIEGAGLHFEPVIAFQAHYGGLEYVARDGHGFHFDLFFSGCTTRTSNSLISEEDDSIWYFDIGSSRTAQS